MKEVDMSSKAIDTRLRRVAQLRRLCLSLQRAGKVVGKEVETGERRLFRDSSPSSEKGY
jgi:hypothetical protein